SPFVVANRSKWPGAQYFVLLSMRYGGPDVFQRAMDKKIKFTDDAFIKAGNELLRQVKAGWFPAGANGLNSDQGQDRMMFYQGQAAMMIMTSGTIASIMNENKDFFDKNLAIGLYPSIDGYPGKSTDLLSGGNVFSPSSGKNRDIAAKFVAYLASDQQLQQELLGTGAIPIRQGLSTDNPIVKDLLAQMASATYLQNFIDQTLSADLAELHKDTTQALFGQTMTAVQAADAMQKAFDAAAK
ncbi:MAG: extracellular solute-binding protein, partial [Treponema sp.]|nr:extracellular solute-binding protein [Treponema sp.]